MKAPTPKDIRSLYSDFMNDWSSIRDEAKIDMRYVAGDPWDPADRAQREDAGRPCISLDELNQYLNQYNNNLRQNKRAIQLVPKGNGANDKDATRREAIVRGIENRSNAPSGAYIVAAENAASRSYGFALIRTEFKDDKSFDQQIVIQPVLDPDTILLDPGYEKPDASDLDQGFVLKRMRKSEFKRKYPHADKISFTPEDMRGDKKPWIGDKDLQIAEFWKRHKVPRTLLLVKGPAGETIVWEDEFEGIKRDARGKIKKGGIEVLREREVMTPEVIQYLTNGLEILDEIPWAGSRIPIISCFGKELWYDDGEGSKRHLLSMVRLARDAQMLFAYLSTQECEEAGMTPKAPFMGAKGQFESAREQWELLNKQPYAFIEYDIVIDGANVAIPPPARPQWTPNFQSYEIAKDSAKRSIQAAMGISPLPTAAQRDSEKSGIALEKIANQESVGSFHFQDNFTNGFLHNMGWQINELIAPILDTQQEVPISNADGTHDTLHTVGVTSHPIDENGNYDEPQLPEDVNGEHLHTGKGDFDVTISTGPSYQSQREQASEFIDHLIENWQQLGIPPAISVKILAIGIKMKDLGAMGDAIAELLNPPDQNNFPPAAQAALANLQAQLQQAQEQIQQYALDHAAKITEQNTKLQIEQMKGQQKGQEQAAKFITSMSEADKDRETKLAVAEIMTKAQVLSERMAAIDDVMSQFRDHAHEVATMMQEHKHSLEIGQQQAATAQQAQASAQGADAQSQASDQAHDMVKTSAGQAHEQTMAQQAQENQPEPGQ